MSTPDPQDVELRDLIEQTITDTMQATEPDEDGYYHWLAESPLELANAVLAALSEAGRLLPTGGEERTEGGLVIDGRVHPWSASLPTHSRRVVVWRARKEPAVSEPWNPIKVKWTAADLARVLEQIEAAAEQRGYERAQLAAAMAAEVAINDARAEQRAADVKALRVKADEADRTMWAVFAAAADLVESLPLVTPEVGDGG